MADAILTPQLRSLLDELKKSSFERNIPYMYVDSVGKITVGVGHNLTAYKDQTTLRFIVKRTERHAVRGGDKGPAVTTAIGRPASGPEIQNDFNFLAMHAGLGRFLATQLAKYTTVELGAADIDALFTSDLDRAIAGARHVIGQPLFDGLPVTCQAALIDIQFNTGHLERFPTLLRAIKGTGEFAGKEAAFRYAAAARESRRPQVSDVRNTQIKNWFDAAAPLIAPTPIPLTRP